MPEGFTGAGRDNFSKFVKKCYPYSDSTNSR